MRVRVSAYLVYTHCLHPCQVTVAPWLGFCEGRAPGLSCPLFRGSIVLRDSLLSLDMLPGAGPTDLLWPLHETSPSLLPVVTLPTARVSALASSPHPTPPLSFRKPSLIACAFSLPPGNSG